MESKLKNNMNWKSVVRSNVLFLSNWKLVKMIVTVTKDENDEEIVNLQLKGR